MIFAPLANLELIFFKLVFFLFQLVLGSFTFSFKFLLGGFTFSLGYLFSGFTFIFSRLFSSFTFGLSGFFGGFALAAVSIRTIVLGKNRYADHQSKYWQHQCN